MAAIAHVHDTCNDCHTSLRHCRDTGIKMGKEDGLLLCRGCYRNRYEICLGCGTTHRDNQYFSNRKRNACSYCRNNGFSFDPIRKPSKDKESKTTKPGFSERRFGVELETSNRPNYTWAFETDWGVKYDGSISGREFVSPPIGGEEGLKSVVAICEQLESKGYNVDRRCGFHLHVDLSDTTPKQRKALALAYWYTKDMWAALIHPSRRDTEYAHYNEGSDHTDAPSWTRQSIMDGDDYPDVERTRYVWLNWRSFSRHSTVEIRSHEPTTDATVVVNWTKAHTLFVDYMLNLSVGQVTRRLGNKNPEQLLDFMVEVWNNKEVHEFYKTKMKTLEEVS